MTACGTHVPPRFHASELPANQILHLTKEHCGPCAAYITKTAANVLERGVHIAARVGDLCVIGAFT